ncbi:MAG: hypothetical protein GF344_14730 [Chitinivibrionales bacterium]|nr:hypothetical protein [Chitinivibrionales bacterium]
MVMRKGLAAALLVWAVVQGTPDLVAPYHADIYTEAHPEGGTVKGGTVKGGAGGSLSYSGSGYGWARKSPWSRFPDELLLRTITTTSLFRYASSPYRRGYASPPPLRGHIQAFSPGLPLPHSSS